MDLTAQARTVFGADRFAVHTGIVIESAGDHEATCRLLLDDRHRNARGVAMGGVLFTLADFTAAIAANSEHLADSNQELHWVSLNSNIHFLSPASGDAVVAHCTAQKTGRATALYQTIISSLDNGKTVAIVETTFFKLVAGS